MKPLNILTLVVLSLVLAWLSTSSLTLTPSRAEADPLPPLDVNDPNQDLCEIPTGCILAYPGPNVPDRWLLCDGATYRIEDYPDLFAVVGRTYTAHHIPAEDFQVPDLRQRVPVGQHPQYSHTKQLGKHGGQSYHRLTSNEMPQHKHDVSAAPHTHTITTAPHSHVLNDPGHQHNIEDPGHRHSLHDPGHNHRFELHDEGGRDYIDDSGRDYRGTGHTDSAVTGIRINNSTTGLRIVSQTTGLSLQPAPVAVSLQTADLTLTEKEKGNNQPFNNMQPYLILNYIIRAF